MPTYTTLQGFDTYILNSSATTNYGTENTIRVGESNAAAEVYRSLIKDSFSGIPANATIKTATLKLTPTNDFSDNTRTLRVYRQKRVWVASEATWNIYSTGNNWQTAGGFGANDCEQTDIGSVSISASQTVNSALSVSIPLNAAKIQEMINGTFANNGFLLKVDTENNDLFRYTSLENLVVENRWQIVIEYTVPQNGKPIFANFGIA